MGDRDEASDDGVQAISALGEPSRRALYDAVAKADDWVSRYQAADATGMERGTAAHHLDRLAAEGLLEIDFKRLTGRSGPGAGRPAKMYRRADRDFDVSLPPRDYRLAGRLLARAVDRSRSEDLGVTEALAEEAAKEGRRWAEAIRSRLRDATSRRASTRRDAIVGALETQGFEPALDDDGVVVLRNCPFDYLAAEHTDLICNMNVCLIDATITGVGRSGVTARLDPVEGQCCVKLVPK
jgi:predicted ArsR family transcriptional regulator